MIDGVAGTDGAGCLDLDYDSLIVDGRYQVDFPVPYPSVALQHCCAPVLQEAGGYVLAESTELVAAQMAEVGSSSSMLTSRNVITLTLFTNLAGRYMSHTHASFNSSSK